MLASKPGPPYPNHSPVLSSYSLPVGILKAALAYWPSEGEFLEGSTQYAVVSPSPSFTRKMWVFHAPSVYSMLPTFHKLTLEPEASACCVMGMPMQGDAIVQASRRHNMMTCVFRVILAAHVISVLG